MVDFNINLAKTMASSPEERQRFYNRMLIYLVICAAAMVYVAYLGSANIMKVIGANKSKRALIRTAASVTEFGKTFIEDPGKTSQELKDYAKDLEILRDSIARRAQFLPVINELFLEFPENIALQTLTATSSDKTIRFGLVAPVFDEKGESPVAKLQTQWKQDEELLQRAYAVRQITSERRVLNDTAAVFVKFECVLK